MKMRYSVETRDRIYVKGYGFSSFAKSRGEKLSNNYSQKLLDSAKKTAMGQKTSTSEKSRENYYYIRRQQNNW